MESTRSTDSTASLPSMTAPSVLSARTIKPQRTLWYHANSLWLFTFSDLKTIVIPKTAFGIIILLSGPILTSSHRPRSLVMLRSLAVITIWTWLNLLPLDINNQQSEDDLEEDSRNKPWRPIPAGRLTVNEAKRLMLASYAAAVLASALFGGLPECLALILGGWIYNVLGGANNSCLARNVLNATGYMTFAAGAARVACIQSGTEIQQGAHVWFVLLGAVIATTIQFQDLYDQEGDGARGRRTMPLVLGDWNARLSIGLPIAVWSFLCPAFWRLDAHGFVLPVCLGAVLIFRLFHYQSVSADKASFRVWNAWVIALYLLPLVKAMA